MKKAFTAALLFFAFSLSYSQTFSLSAARPKVGDYYRSYQILFEFAKAPLLPQCYPSLDSVVTFLEQHPTVKIEIGVHSVLRGSDISNNDLTRNRAISIQNYFISKGIAASRLKAVGYGKTKPLVSREKIKKSGDDSYTNVNRRVEFKILAL